MWIERGVYLERMMEKLPCPQKIAYRRGPASAIPARVGRLARGLFAATVAIELRAELAEHPIEAAPASGGS